jgi:hypothetical protein
MQFSQTSGVSSPTDLIPSGFLCWAMVTMRGMKNSQSSTSRYADLELVVADNQPNARRKIWTKIGDPDHEGNSEGYRTMGMTSLTRMLESAGFVDPKDPKSYEALNGRSCEEILMALDGKYVAIKVKIEAGKDGHADKNDVGDFLTPNELSSSYKAFKKLEAGDHGIQANPAARPGAGGGFGGVAKAPAPLQQGFGRPATPPSQGPSERPLETPNTGAVGSTTSLSSQGPARAPFNPNQRPSFLG